MDSESRIRQISPILAVADMEVILAFYAEVLGFNVVLREPDYSIVEKDGTTIHFTKAADDSVMQAVRGHASIYIEVDDIQPLWQRVQPYRDRYKITEPSVRSYGMTEFHVNDPNDCLIFVGQETTR